MKRYLCILKGDSDPPSGELRVEKCILVVSDAEKLLQYTLDGKIVDEFTISQNTNTRGSDSVLWVAPSFAGQTTIVIHSDGKVEYNMPGSGLISIFNGLGKLRKLNDNEFPGVPEEEQNDVIIDINEHFDEKKEVDEGSTYVNFLWMFVLFLIIAIVFLKNFAK